MSVELDVKNLQGEVYRLRQAIRQQKSLMGMLMGQGLQDLVAQHGMQQYGDGYVRIDKFGMQFVTGYTAGMKGIFWRSTDDGFLVVQDVPTTDATKINSIQQLGFAAAPILEWSVNAYGSAVTKKAYVYVNQEGTFSEAEIAATVAVGTRSGIYFYSDATERYAWLTGPLRLDVVAADDATQTDGQLWYRSDTDKFRARANGVTENLATESYGAGAYAPIASVKPSILLRPGANEAPAAAFATADVRNGHPVLDFDGTTDEEAVWTAVLPASYAGGGLTVNTWWSLESVTTGSLRVQAAIERIDVSSLDVDADSFTAFQSAGGSAPATNGMVIKVAVAFTSGAAMDSLAAGELFRVKIRRDADGTSGTDDITEDANLYAVQIVETA